MSWRWFKYWRKRYVWLRLAILVLVFAGPVHCVFRPTIRELVVIAIKGIEAAKLGPGLYARTYEFHEKKRLQGALLAKFDANGDGVLSRAEARRLTGATALTAEEVTGRALDVELDALVEASHKAGTLSRVVTGKDIRRQALSRAVQEQEAEHVALWRDLDPMLEMQYPRAADYLRWETWQHGVNEFRVVLAYGGFFPGRYFVGIPPRTYHTVAFDPYTSVSGWRGYIGWALLLAAIALSIGRYGQGEALRKRFREDPELALARCPICNSPTNDYGALRQHRWPRAWATGAVVVLTVVAVAALSRDPAGGTVLGAAAGIVAGFLRWLLWPREMHFCHRWPSARVLGTAAAAVVVVGVVSQVAVFTMREFEWPRRGVWEVQRPRSQSAAGSAVKSVHAPPARVEGGSGAKRAESRRAPIQRAGRGRGPGRGSRPAP